MATSRSTTVAIVALAVLVVGPLGAAIGLLPSMVGLGLFVCSGALGVVAVVWGVVAKLGSKARGGALAAVIGMVPLLCVAASGALAMGVAQPRINDITTDTSDPPAFVKATQHGDYPGEFVALAENAYPDIKTLELAIPVGEAVDLVLEIARERDRWEMVATTDAGFEAYERSRIFRFRDDFVVRVRAAGGGAVVDMRSASRQGKSDLGVNAARIESFLAAVSRRASGSVVSDRPRQPLR